VVEEGAEEEVKGRLIALISSTGSFSFNFDDDFNDDFDDVEKVETE